MNVDSKLIDIVVNKVMHELKSGNQDGSNVFTTMEDAISAAKKAYLQLRTMSIEKREEILQAIRTTALDNAAALAVMAVKETGMGRVDHKIIKNKLVANKTPGTEVLNTQAFSGDKGLTIVEMAPFGVIGAITPCTNPTETVICNSIGMIAAGNAVVFSPHPAATKTSIYIISLINDAIIKAGGPPNLLTTVRDPSIEQANIMMHHPNVNLLVATGGPGVVKAVLSSGKKAIGAGAGNPPVVVDQTADIAKAGRDIINGCSFDNNLPCVAEKEVIAVGCIADELMSYMRKNGGYQLKGSEIDKLINVVLHQKDGHYSVNKEYVGKDANYLLKKIGSDISEEVSAIFCEVPVEHPFVQEELMMPIIPVVQVKDIDTAIEMAVQVEHGNRHTAIMHSKNVDNMTRFARAVQTTIFVKNGPSYAGIGVGGEGYTTFTIAGPTGEGLTCAKTFTRLRRCVLVDGFSIV